MSCIDNYKKRVSLSGSVDSRVRVIYEARKNFERSLKKDPSSRTLKITDIGEVNISESTKLVQCIVNDFSKNDQKTFDEKVLYVRYDENVGLGSYVEYDGYIWLVIFREHRAADVYKSFIMRKCNQILKYKYEDVIYDIPCIVRNLTQYSDGMQDVVYTSTPDSRRSIMYSQNIVTSNINLGHRFLLNNRSAYRITHIQDFEYKESYSSQNGVTTCIAIYTSLLSEDSTDENLAFNEDDNNNVEYDTLMIGTSRTYGVEDDACKWEIKYLSDNSDYVNMYIDNGKCVISVDMDFDLVGEVFELRALSLEDEVILKRDITVVGFI